MNSKALSNGCNLLRLVILLTSVRCTQGFLPGRILFSFTNKQLGRQERTSTTFLKSAIDSKYNGYGQISFANQTDVPSHAANSENPRLLAIDAAAIEIVSVSELENLAPNDYESSHESTPPSKASIYPFVDMLRGAATYIGNHRGVTSVIHLPSSVIENPDKLADFMDDVALCWLLGMKIVLVIGFKQGDKKDLREFEEEVGFARFEVERQLNRCLRLHGSISSSSNEFESAPDGNVVGGSFYTARPIDDIYARPVNVKVDKIEQVLNLNDIVLLTPVGIGNFGDAFVVNSCELAARVASSLKASKLIYMASESTVLRNKETKRLVKNFSLSFAKSLIEHHDARGSKLLKRIRWATSALQQGVSRAHIVGPTDGALLEELFTAKDGYNTCISQDEYASPHPDDEFDDDLFANFVSSRTYLANE